jgi:MSHA biogenesis protein MshG
MARFRWFGRGHGGKPVNGNSRAATSELLAVQLIAQGVTPVRIEQAGAGAELIDRTRSWFSKQNVRSVDLLMFCRQMYTISKAGIPLTRGLRSLSSSIRNEYFCAVLNDLAERVQTGMSFSQSMRYHPDAFDDLFVNLVGIGETSGKLQEVFQLLGFYIERDVETRKQIQTAFRYPIFVVIALAIALTIINIFVIPSFAELFAKFDADLPLVTRALIGFSDIWVGWWHVLLVSAIVAGIAVRQFLVSERGAMLWGEKKLKLPLIGSLVNRASLARYTRSLSLMLKAGVPLTESLGLSAGILENSYFARKIEGICDGVKRGESLMQTHTRADIFSPLVLQMIAIGEESGQVEELLAEVAQFYEREVDYDLKTLTSRIEPLLIITMAIFVAILALGVFLPMWGLYDAQAG